MSVDHRSDHAHEAASHARAIATAYVTRDDDLSNELLNELLRDALDVPAVQLPDRAALLVLSMANLLYAALLACEQVDPAGRTRLDWTGFVLEQMAARGITY